MEQLYIMLVSIIGCTIVGCCLSCLAELICECIMECCYYKCENCCPCFHKWRQFNKIRKDLVKEVDLNVECCICNEKQVNIITECKHLYHRACLEKWALSCKERFVPVTCPQCRSTINKAYPVFVLDRIV